MQNSLQIFELHPLFEMVQMQQVFPDGKTFVDVLPKKDLEEISALFLREKEQPGFDLKRFVSEYFEEPHTPGSGYKSDNKKTAIEHIQALWPVLTRQPDTDTGSTLIPLPHPYIVPGGRFGEIYYWDSYFTMLGLKASGNIAMMENMVNNFAYLVEEIGYIPNGNRSYYLGRSQPPFFALMVALLSEVKGTEILIRFLPQMQKEYDFWMQDVQHIQPGSVIKRVVCLPGGEIMNRYYDANDTPRPESYREDVELSENATQPTEKLFRNIRAAAESGWDFSSRWFKDMADFASIHTTDILPVDLNCLLYKIETILSTSYELTGNMELADHYLDAASKRKAAIQKYCWDDAARFYFDYDFIEQKRKEVISAAAFTTLFFEVARAADVPDMLSVLQDQLLQPGGVLTTPVATGQQWDAPNGWAPLQWIVVKGLVNYGHEQLAKDIAARWLQLNEEVYKRTGSMMEKYNVINPLLEAGGGEYPGQDGFGWTNGVFMAMKELMGDL